MVLSQVQQVMILDVVLFFHNSTITTLTNDGTISGTAGDDVDVVLFFHNSTITTLTNNDTISGTAGDVLTGAGS